MSILGAAASVLDRCFPNYLRQVRLHYYLSDELRFFLFPETFTEWVQHRKLFHRNPLLTRTADKIRARDYVASLVGSEYLVPLYASFDDPSQIGIESLPRPCVLKANHGCGFNLFLRENEAVDIDVVRSTATRWMNTEFWKDKNEWAYKHIRRRVFAEKMLTENGATPNDYKFFVFNGRVRLIQVDTDRHGAHRRSLFDEAWRPLNVHYRYPKPELVPERPAQLTEGIGLAEQLAAQFEFVRVDLYFVGGRIYFGELSHYPNGGLSVFEPCTFDRALGDVLRFGTPIPATFFQAPCQPMGGLSDAWTPDSQTRNPAAAPSHVPATM